MRAADAKPTRFLLFNLKQRIQVGNEWYTIWFPPDNLLQRAGLLAGPGFFRDQFYKKGDDIIKLRVVSGDHLFVDRFTYNFRHPERGEIIVFKTEAIEYDGVPKNQFYIKRLIGMPGDTIKINTNDHVVIDDKPLTAADPGFEKIYGQFDHRYVGHTHVGLLADPTNKYVVDPGNYFVMGDNTRNSLDSRYWGEFPEHSVIGRSYFVYWPISDRFGWGYHR